MRTEMVMSTHPLTQDAESSRFVLRACVKHVDITIPREDVAKSQYFCAISLLIEDTPPASIIHVFEPTSTKHNFRSLHPQRTTDLMSSISASSSPTVKCEKVDGSAPIRLWWNERFAIAASHPELGPQRFPPQARNLEGFGEIDDNEASFSDFRPCLEGQCKLLFITVHEIDIYGRTVTVFQGSAPVLVGTTRTLRVALKAATIGNEFMVSREGAEAFLEYDYLPEENVGEGEVMEAWSAALERARRAERTAESLRKRLVASERRAPTISSLPLLPLSPSAATPTALLPGIRSPATGSSTLATTSPMVRSSPVELRVPRAATPPTAGLPPSSLLPFTVEPAATPPLSSP
eukprot:CAMPEP_0113666708 /NCGR_PEP_ID=MMETSP0038_2-20120614/3026_1 /TAXON_ID=2898 /ORGANISM="Cryptomonas paramecium" /LENGTH=348 /DNA_ID=CAMNT_0000582233 /DNA_START=79 /DNA_END=1122 /DNA_ORIENTATION=- /assembly_acc=CAM_ASM_000170